MLHLRHLSCAYRWAKRVYCKEIAEGQTRISGVKTKSESGPVRGRTFGIKDSFMSEVTMVDLPTPSGAFRTRRVSRPQ